MIDRDVYDSYTDDVRVSHVERVKKFRKWEVDLSYRKMIDEVFCLCMVYWQKKKELLK
jgi:hypothetical protein